ncbi:MAG TPA: Ig-like domain-containing protein, partial [Gemmatimonadales bacterium]|nr:Ig-like domain-containing protein [Gemmatimonadales bacterium]
MAQAPGGFIESDDSVATRRPWTTSQIQRFLPLRGTFAFPAPYNTEGIRLTNATDCGGKDCVLPIASSYGHNINNHRGRDTVLVVLELRGVGPTLFGLSKATGKVRNLGPLFDSSSPYASTSGEGWYFSGTQPSKLYVTGALSAQLQRYDVFTKTFQTVFDAGTQFGAGTYVSQAQSSDDDNVHSATLSDSSSHTKLGCLAYREDARQYSYYPATEDYSECQIDKSGRWLVIKEELDGVPGRDNLIVDLETGIEKVLPRSQGAGGSSDNGYGYMVAADEGGGLPGTVRVWDFDKSLLQGSVVYTTSSGAGSAEHIAHSNAAPGVPRSQQYACAANATLTAAPRANEIVCFRLDGSRDALVVAPSMTDPSAPRVGGRNRKQPNGNLDVSGGYFIWVGEVPGGRADAFMVKVPGHLLRSPSSGAMLPMAAPTEPASDSTLRDLSRVRPAAALALPDPTLLPAATTAQVPLTSAYNALNVPSIAPGGSYLDPTTNTKIYKLTSATFPTSSANWGHDYSEGNDEVSLPYNGNTRAVMVYSGGSHWLLDFTPGVGVSNPRLLTGNLAPIMDLAFTFSSNPATPYYAYVSRGSTIYRVDIRTMTEAPGNGWPVTGETSAVWLHQSENDGMFVWMRGAAGSTIVAFEPSTNTKKTYTNSGLNEPRIDRAGRYVGIAMNGNGLFVWDWNTSSIIWTTPGDPGIPYAHTASLRRRWMGVDWNMSYPPDFTKFIPDVPNSATHVGGPANATLVHGNGNWIQHPADLDDQWALFTHYGSLRPPESYWLAPGGMVLITANGQRRLLGHPYNTTGNYTFFSFAKFSPDGKYVLFTSDMNGSARSDVFLAELPTSASSDTTPPTVAITTPAAAATVSGTSVTVSANASDNVGVVGVQFKLDGNSLAAEDTSAPYSVSWDTTLSANGSHSLTAVARDAAGNSTTSIPVVVTVLNVDTTPPVISLVLSSSISSLAATITWTTNEPADSQVEYGTTTSYGSSTTLNASLILAHSQALGSLTPGTLYHYRVKSRDGAGNPATSGDFTFTTLPLDTGLIAYLKLDEGTGTGAADSSGSGNAGTLMNGATWTAGTRGTGVALDGVTHYVRVADAPMLDAFPLTAAIWFKTSTTAGVRGLLNKYVANSSDGYQIFFSNGNLCAWYLADASNYVWNGTGCTMSTAGYNDDVWHQAVLVVDALGGRLYVDGTQRASQPWTGVAGPPTTTQEVHLGHYPGAFGGAEYLPAVIDEFQLYNRALIAAEVLQLYNDSKPVTDTTPPVLSGVGVTTISATSATIVWTTNEPSDSQVEYGPTTAYGSSTALNPALVTSHSQVLSGLVSSTLYHYRVKSKDAAANLA